MSYSVLLGAREEALQHRISSLLSELPDIHLSSIINSSSEVSAQLAEDDGVDCLLLHDGLGPLPVLDLIREVTSRRPSLAVVLIVDDPRADVLASAMESGARGVVSTNPSLEDLETRIGNAGDWSRSMRRHLEGYDSNRPTGGTGRLIALAGAKGGTGTTTVAIHLALAAARTRSTVCLVDMDLQTGDLATYLDITHRRSIAELAEAANDLNPTVLADALFAHRLGPHVLLAPREGERSEDIDGKAAGQILGSLRSRYDLVIVDCGANVSEANSVAAELADRVVVTALPDLPSMRGARRLAEMWERLHVRKRDDLAVLLNRQTRSSEIQPEFARKMLRLNLLHTTVPAVFRSLEAAVNTGSPAEVSDPGFRKAVAKLLGELGGRGAAASASPPPNESAKTVEPPRKPKRRHKKGRGESGQATVEFIGLLPVLLVIVLFLWEAVVVGMAMMTASHGANEGARAAAVGKTPKEVRKEVRDHMLSGSAKRADIDYQPHDPKVTVSMRVPILMPRIQTPWSMTSSAKVVPE